ITSELQGEPLSRFRRVFASPGLHATERLGYRGFELGKHISQSLKAAELWQTRPRNTDNFGPSIAVLDRIVELVGRDVACHIVFAEERAYWERRNRAGQVQKRRQDILGLGWANHDHHTFRSSREHFLDLMRVLEKLGFER